MIENMKGTPQQPNPNKPGTIIPVQVAFDAPEEGEVTPVEEKVVDIRRMRISMDMLTKYGFTEGCEGCKFKKAGMKGARGHTETCRRRIMEAVSQEEEGFERIRRDQERLEWRRNERQEIRREGEAERETEPRAEPRAEQRAEPRERTEQGEPEPMQLDEAETVENEAKDSVMRLMKVLGKMSEAEVEELARKQVDLVEIYSPPRVAKEAAKYRLSAGASMDLTIG